MDLIPLPLLTGAGVITMFTLSWWWLNAGFLHTDREFTNLERERDDWKATADKWEKVAREATEQNGILIKANATTAHALEGIRQGMEARK